jgi:GNAT superfamily N-acetyltransferase
MSNVRIREATLADAEAISLLHATSWRSAYRGLLSDEYLDNDLFGERRKYWLAKMPVVSEKEFVLIAEVNETMVGFIAVMDIPEKGYSALVDNLHVIPSLKGSGIGSEMLRHAARRLLASGRNSFYLWVLEGNTDAGKFYLAKGGKSADQHTSEFGGKVVTATRFVWNGFEALFEK